MPNELCLVEARELVRTNADLRELIAFTRAHDPTQALRAAWGTEYGTRLEEALARAGEAYQQGKPFLGTADEALLGMAHCVGTAPYLGTPEAVVHRYLHSLLRALVER